VGFRDNVRVGLIPKGNDYSVTCCHSVADEFGTSLRNDVLLTLHNYMLQHYPSVEMDSEYPQTAFVQVENRPSDLDFFEYHLSQVSARISHPTSSLQKRLIMI
jgi:hypothetical protein